MIRILRRQATGAPSTLAFGRMAFSEGDKILYIGLHDDTLLAIGGEGLFALKSYVDDAIAGVAAGETAFADITGAPADNTALAAVLALLAPLADPAFTGNPTAPTQAAGNNTTRIATTAFVSTALANLINSAPGALDTLKELADAIGDDANFASTVTNALALKAPLADPVFTGNPTAPTPARGDNDTSVATTAFVQDALDDGTF
jgi:hypothetical protein